MCVYVYVYISLYLSIYLSFFVHLFVLFSELDQASPGLMIHFSLFLYPVPTEKIRKNESFADSETKQAGFSRPGLALSLHL